MKVRHVLATAVAFGTTLLTHVPSAHADSPPSPVAPVFFNTPGRATFAISPPTVTGFTLTGYASDPQAGETVDFALISLPPFLQLTSMPGNPASFTLTATGLDYRAKGVYDVGIAAFDNSPQQHVTSQLIIITIVPEPTTTLVGATAFAFLAHRRRPAVRSVR